MGLVPAEAVPGRIAGVSDRIDTINHRMNPWP